MATAPTPTTIQAAQQAYQFITLVTPFLVAAIFNALNRS